MPRRFTLRNLQSSRSTHSRSSVKRRRARSSSVKRQRRRARSSSVKRRRARRKHNGGMRKKVTSNPTYTALPTTEETLSMEHVVKNVVDGKKKRGQYLELEQHLDLKEKLKQILKIRFVFVPEEHSEDCRLRRVKRRGIVLKGNQKHRGIFRGCFPGKSQSTKSQSTNRLTTKPRI